MDLERDATVESDTEPCPFPCQTCRQPGDCEDCLRCLHWPDPVPEPPEHPRPPRGPASPTRTDEVEAARATLDLGRRVGLVLRRVRGRHGLSQAALARRVAWSSSSLSRVEEDASCFPLARVDDVLRRVGHRLAIVADDGAHAVAPSELPDETWGTEDLVSRDRRGRRFPPFAVLTWEDPGHRVVYRRHGQALPEWTWTRPRP